MVNGHELAARLRKAQRIISVLDSVARGAGAAPKAMAHFVANMTDAEWASACLIAGVKLGSAETRRIVVKTFEDRARDADTFNGWL